MMQMEMKFELIISLTNNNYLKIFRHAHERLCAGVSAYKIEKMLRPEEALI